MFKWETQPNKFILVRACTLKISWFLRVGYYFPSICRYKKCINIKHNENELIWCVYALYWFIDIETSDLGYLSQLISLTLDICESKRRTWGSETHSSKLNHSRRWARKSSSWAKSDTDTRPLLSLKMTLSKLRHRTSSIGWSRFGKEKFTYWTHLTIKDSWSITYYYSKESHSKL